MTITGKSSPLLEVTVTVLVPAIILMKWSGPQDLGPLMALMLALAFPLGWSARELLARRRPGLIVMLGLVSTLLTGGIGLMQLDAGWLAIKEAAVPGLIGIAVIGSLRTRYPLIRTLLYNPSVVDVERVQAGLAERGVEVEFETRLQRATWMLGGTFFFSSAMNYFLATWAVTSPAGTQAFNEELGRMTLLSYPVIALPSTIMMMFVLYYLARTIRELTGLRLAEVLRTARPDD